MLEIIEEIVVKEDENMEATSTNIVEVRKFVEKKEEVE